MFKTVGELAFTVRDPFSQATSSSTLRDEIGTNQTNLRDNNDNEFPTIVTGINRQVSQNKLFKKSL